jgi:hypothetical protein
MGDDSIRTPGEKMTGFPPGVMMGALAPHAGAP